MKLETLIKQNAARCKDYTVEISTSLPTVSITDDNEPDNVVFMQDDEAQNFIDECDALEKRTDGTISREQIELCIASPYIENLFN